MSLSRLVWICRTLRDAGWSEERRREFIAWRIELYRQAHS